MMNISHQLKAAIAHELAHLPKTGLAIGRADLSERYRQAKTTQPFMVNSTQKASYVATRMPATYAAIFSALKQIKRALPDLKIGSLLDLGAGPGTIMWAATEIFPELNRLTLLEQDEELARLGQRLAAQHAQLSSANWQQINLEKCDSLPPHDLVILSYSFGEINNPRLLELALQAATKVIVVIEPGTPVGFERIRLIRHRLIQHEWHLAAPCPHENICPMTGTNWCHFSARVERSALHRSLKAGELNYEDEKFSYIAASKQKPVRAETRVLRHPQKRKGHLNLELCAQKGLLHLTVSQKDGERYKMARKLEWGDEFYAANSSTGDK